MPNGSVPRSAAKLAHPTRKASSCGSGLRPGGRVPLDSSERLDGSPRKGLPAEFQRKLELARVIGGGGLSGKAGCAGGWVAELIDGGDVGAIKKVESVGDEVEAQAFPERDAARNAHIPSEIARPGEGVPAQVAVASGWRRQTRHALATPKVTPGMNGEVVVPPLPTDGRAWEAPRSRRVSSPVITLNGRPEETSTIGAKVKSPMKCFQAPSPDLALPVWKTALVTQRWR